MSRRQQKLWIGGSSCLAETYMNTFCEADWILLGFEKTAPRGEAAFISCDLTDGPDAERALACLSSYRITHVVIGLRPALVSLKSHSESWIYNESLLLGLREFLKELAQEHPISRLVHLSSIAAVDHCLSQEMVSTQQPEPKLESLRYPYDWFKRACEELLLDKALVHIPSTSIRIGAIFSDSPSCIQCGALALQMFFGPYLRIEIDGNSGRNVASFLRLVLNTQSDLRKVYYYTRPLFSKPVPYGESLVSYRRAYNLGWLPMIIPSWLVSHRVVPLIHWLANNILPCLQSIDYLMQVTIQPHSFDMKETQEDFSEEFFSEETIDECFARRRRQHQQRK